MSLFRQWPVIIFASFSLILCAYLSLADAGIFFNRGGGCANGNCALPMRATVTPNRYTINPSAKDNLNTPYPDDYEQRLKWIGDQFVPFPIPVPGVDNTPVPGFDSSPQKGWVTPGGKIITPPGYTIQGNGIPYPDNSPMPSTIIVEATDLNLSPFEATEEQVAYARPLPAAARATANVGAGAVRATATVGRGAVRGSAKVGKAAVKAPVRAVRFVGKARPLRRAFGLRGGC